MKTVYKIGALLLLIIYVIGGSRTIEEDLFGIIMIATYTICGAIYELIDVIKNIFDEVE